MSSLGQVVLLRVVEVLISAGLVMVWAGIVHYHAQQWGLPTTAADAVKQTSAWKDAFIPTRAILYVLPDMDSVSFYFSLLGVVLSFSSALFGLTFFDFSKNHDDSKWIGVFTAFVLIVSAWYLFRVEGTEAIQNLLDDDLTNDKEVMTRDLWAPLISNLVLVALSLVLVVHNGLKLALFQSLPARQQMGVKIGIFSGVVLGFCYFSVMIYAHFTAGFVMLVTSPFVVIVAFTTGRVLEWKRLQHDLAGGEEVDEEKMWNQVSWYALEFSVGLGLFLVWLSYLIQFVFLINHTSTDVEDMLPGLEIPVASRALFFAGDVLFGTASIFLLFLMKHTMSESRKLQWTTLSLGVAMSIHLPIIVRAWLLRMNDYKESRELDEDGGGNIAWPTIATALASAVVVVVTVSGAMAVELFEDLRARFKWIKILSKICITCGIACGELFFLVSLIEYRANGTVYSSIVMLSISFLLCAIGYIPGRYLSIFQYTLEDDELPLLLSS